MYNMIKNKKGFTLIEIVIAFGILVLVGSLTLVSLSAIPQARMRNFAQTIKSEFELTRNFAKTHGGDAVFSIQKNEVGLHIKRTMGENLSTGTVAVEEEELKDRKIALFYKMTDDNKIYELGKDDADSVSDSTLKMTFSQTHGSIIGPHMLDYIIISNGSNNFKLMIKQSTGMMYYDYEVDENEKEGNIVNNDTTIVQLPYFIASNGELVETIEIPFNGQAIQPEINYDSRYIKIGGVYRHVEPGKFTITFTLKDPYSTMWEDRSTAQKTLTWKIK